MKFTKHGFTLIELLVVIAIIAILAAILFPVFAQAREKARQSSCLSNMKQLSTAFFLYADDYDECFPCYNAVNHNGSEWYDWVTSPTYGFSFWSPFISVYPYYKNAKLLICPSQAKPTASAPSFRVAYWNMDGNNYDYSSSYGMNSGISTSNGDPWAPSPVSLAQLQTTGNFILLTEGNTPQTDCITGPHQTEIRHNGGSNFGFCDGHAKYIKCPNGDVTQWPWPHQYNNYNMNLDYRVDVNRQ